MGKKYVIRIIKEKRCIHLCRFNDVKQAFVDTSTKMRSRVIKTSTTLLYISNLFDRDLADANINLMKELEF